MQTLEIIAAGEKNLNLHDYLWLNHWLSLSVETQCTLDCSVHCTWDRSSHLHAPQVSYVGIYSICTEGLS